MRASTLLSVGRSYLITGGAGFIGSHLSEALLARGDRVFVIDDLSTGKESNIAHLFTHPHFHFARASVLDPIVLDRLASQSEVIFHLAAAVGVELIVKHPVRTIETNIMGSEAVLKSAQRYRAKVLIASTSEVYGKGVSVPFREDDDVLLGATSRSRWAYAVSKMADESLALSYAQEFGLKVVPFRLFNTVGPRQTDQYGMVIPRLVKQALRGEAITVHGDGTQSRCFCHVSDVVRALLLLADAEGVLGRVINIGSEREISISDLADLILRLSKSSSQIVRIPYEKAYAPGFEDMQRRLPSIDRIRSLVGWQPRISLEEILESVIAHERAALEKERSPSQNIRRRSENTATDQIAQI